MRIVASSTLISDSGFPDRAPRVAAWPQRGQPLRLHTGLGIGRLTAAVVALALIGVAAEVEDALGALAIAAAVSSVLIAYEG